MEPRWQPEKDLSWGLRQNCPGFQQYAWYDGRRTGCQKVILTRLAARLHAHCDLHHCLAVAPAQPSHQRSCAKLLGCKFNLMSKQAEGVCSLSPTRATVHHAETRRTKTLACIVCIVWCVDVCLLDASPSSNFPSERHLQCPECCQSCYRYCLLTSPH